MYLRTCGKTGLVHLGFNELTSFFTGKSTGPGAKFMCWQWRKLEGLCFGKVENSPFIRHTDNSAPDLENAAAFLYNNAFSSSYYTTGDGQALVSTSHVNATGGTYSNALNPPADLSEASLRVMDASEVKERLTTAALAAYEAKAQSVGPETMREIERLDDRYRQILDKMNSAGGAIEKIRREMARPFFSTSQSRSSPSRLRWMRGAERKSLSRKDTLPRLLGRSRQIESLPPENSNAGRSNSAATSRMMWMDSASSASRCGTWAAFTGSPLRVGNSFEWSSGRSGVRVLPGCGDGRVYRRARWAPTARDSPRSCVPPGVHDRERRLGEEGLFEHEGALGRGERAHRLVGV